MEAHEAVMRSRREMLLCCALVLGTAMTFVAGTTVPQETDRSKDGLIGPVRQMTIISGRTTTIRSYDRAGALMETMSRLAPPAEEPEAQEQVRRFAYVYNAKEQRVREMSQDQDGLPYLSRRYAYDAGGRQWAEAAYHMCGTFSSLRIFSYDRKGRLQEELLYQYRSLAKRVYAYDDRGFLHTLLSYKNGQLQSTIHSRHDAEGRKLELTESMPDGTPNGKTTYEYDEQGHLMAEHFINALDPSHETTSDYKYDQHGNWIQKTTRGVGGVHKDEPDDQAIEVTERTLVYF